MKTRRIRLFTNTDYRAATADYAPGLTRESIGRLRMVPDLTGATFDMALWSFLVWTAPPYSSGNVPLLFNAANNFTADFKPPCNEITSIQPFYAGVNVGGMLNTGFQIELDLE